MTDPACFEIEELVARYELHPQRKDVFVESDSDQGLFRAFLEDEGFADVAVLPVRVVNVAPHLVLSYGLQHPSRRNELLTLATELESRRVLPTQVVCIVDADFEYLLPQGPRSSLLLLTDYASLELYCFSAEVVHRVLLVAAPNTTWTGRDLVANLKGQLQFLFSALATNVDLQLGLSWIESIDKFFAFQDGQIHFDDVEFMKRYLVDRVPEEVTRRFEGAFSQIQSRLTSDVRCRIRGHDFVKILTWYLRHVERCKHLNEESVRQMLYMSVRPSELGAQPMFCELRRRLQS